jgi:hypothetical protein
VHIGAVFVLGQEVKEECGEPSLDKVFGHVAIARAMATAAAAMGKDHQAGWLPWHGQEARELGSGRWHHNLSGSEPMGSWRGLANHFGGETFALQHSFPVFTWPWRTCPFHVQAMVN